jgi:tetratricopeptide (TPR) repeat protein
MSTTDETPLAAAIAHHDAGRLAEAEQALRELLTSDPNNLAGLTRLGDVLSDASRPAEAIEVYNKVITAAPRDPATAAAYDGVAAALQERGQIDAAVAASKKAVELRHNPDVAYALGNTLERMGRLSDAIEAFRLAAAYRPNFAEAHARLGGLWLATGKLDEAISHYRTATDVMPDLAEAHCNLANALRQRGDETGALASVKRAIELKPEMPEAHNVLGCIWQDRRRPADALAEFVKAAQVRPDYGEALNNAGSVLEQLGRWAEAARFYQNAISSRPEEPRFHHNLALNLLMRGEYAAGWAEHEWRRREPTNPAGRNFGKPEWDGSPIPGKTLLIHTEQGLGDSIQFARYIALAHQQAVAGGDPSAVKIIVETRAPLVPLFASGIGGLSAVITQGQPLPAFDLHLPLFTAPMRFATRVDNVPNQVPYISADPARAGAWAAKMPKSEGKLRIGLAWAGNPRHRNDRIRSCPPSQLEPLASVGGALFFSLQKRDPTQQQLQGSPPAALNIIDLTADLSDFADTAALIANLDLVISVDTAVAHLAGAMGKPVFVMIPSHPDWRWLLDREDSPWYPTMRLFRQPAVGDWASVVGRVREAMVGQVKS